MLCRSLQDQRSHICGLTPLAYLLKAILKRELSGRLDDSQLCVQAAGTYESVTSFARSAARQSSKQIASLGERAGGT